MNNEQPGKGHVHAALMLEYAKDALEHSEPWTLWQYSTGHFPNQWTSCGLSNHNQGLRSPHPDWDPQVKYRRKPVEIPTHVVNGFVVPAPVKCPILSGDEYWYPDSSNERWCGCVHWAEDSVDQRLFSRGQVFSCKEHAAANGMAQCGVDPKWGQS